MPLESKHEGVECCQDHDGWHFGRSSGTCSVEIEADDSCRQRFHKSTPGAMFSVEPHSHRAAALDRERQKLQFSTADSSFSCIRLASVQRASHVVDNDMGVMDQHGRRDGKLLFPCAQLGIIRGHWQVGTKRAL